ncbi:MULTISPECIES: transcriptional regulator CynR [Streptomyces]|uniref:transcriptional regulator CynR n=1 Tax=Streptomyces TaxID=1883 RepID=UPI0006AE0DDB|nr:MULTISPECIES: transcriptional regulator CynR [unclassified Streptomyces]KOU74122.1 transcriptional regulator [Streptomyces sp. IGB124]KOU79575.1 transcriptional regulator [Streptomyces sp. XY58]KOV06004.1 transcriptional regulator [Streptomyces sp. XY37]KOV48348.1 transcriptional regulator [Streptomyces sp. MMG1064]
MALELRHLRYLIAVAEHGSFTRAAEALRISQPTLSQQVKQLERAVGAQLLDRTGRAVRLTDAGATYVHHARGALRDLAAAERAVKDLADLSRGHLRLALTPTFTAYLVGPLVAGLHEAHPGVTLELLEMPQDDIEAGLLADHHDLGLAFDRPHLPGITATPLYTETLGLVVAAEDDGPDPGTGPLPVRALAARRLALLSGDFATRGHVDDYLATHGVRPHIAVEANSVQALTEIVRRTSLATVLPDAVTHDHPHLRQVALDPALPARTVTLLRRESAYESAASRAFTELTARLIRTRGYPRSAG